MKVEEAALDLIALAYDAALAPEKWPVLMERLVKAMGAHSALLRENDYATGRVGLFETVGYDPAYVAAYRDHFVHVDYFAPILPSLPIGAVMTGDQVVPWERQRNTEFYNDYLRPLNNRHVMGCVLARNDRYDLMFALQREIGQPDYDEEDLRLIRLVTPHMARAVQIHRQVAEVTTQKHWALSTLDSLRVGVILLDDRGKPLHLNREAERIVAKGQGVAAGRDGLALPSAAETARLRHLIAAAAAAAKKGSAAGGCLRVRTAAKTILQFQVIPLPRGLSAQAWGHSSCNGCVAVFISATGGPRLSCDRIAALHGLTRAEARLASILADGISLEEAAGILLVSVGTVRSQLKSVFAKTGVSRQAELVALLLADMLTDHAGDQFVTKP